MTNDAICHCTDLRDLVHAALHDIEPPACPVHRPATAADGAPAFALNDDAAIFGALGMTPTSSTY